MKTDAQSLLWRIYAVLLTLACVLPLYHSLPLHHSAFDWANTLLALIACFGVVTWAFGYCIGISHFWKGISVLIAAEMLYGLSVAFIWLMTGQHHGSWFSAFLATIVIWGIVILFLGPACLALFRAGNTNRYT